MKLSGSTATTIPVRNDSGLIYDLDGLRIPPGESVMVPVDFVERYGGIKGLVFDFTAFQASMETSNAQGQASFDFWVPMSMVDGYGRHALAIAQGLRAMDVGVRVQNGQWKGQGQQYVPDWAMDESYRNSRLLPTKVGLCMSVPYDPTYDRLQSVTRIAITQFETDHIPEQHVAVVNRQHHLITTSKFQVPVWKNSGLAIPISVMTPGVDTDLFTYSDRAANWDGKFKVLMLGALTGRKNPMGAIRIFLRAAERDPDWQLTIKTRGAAGYKEMIRFASQDRRIKVIVQDDPPPALVWYYHNHDALIWPSKGEGCGLPPLEALSTGMEVVCANNSGMMDYLSESHAYLIKTGHMEPADSAALEQIYGMKDQGFGTEYVAAYGSVGRWWVPDEDHAVRQLRKAYENVVRGKRKGPKAAAYVRAHHTLRHQADSVFKVVEEYL